VEKGVLYEFEIAGVLFGMRRNKESRLDTPHKS
jgi:hypothetical protein